MLRAQKISTLKAGERCYKTRISAQVSKTVLMNHTYHIPLVMNPHFLGSLSYSFNASDVFVKFCHLVRRLESAIKTFCRIGPGVEKWTPKLLKSAFNALLPIPEKEHLRQQKLVVVTQVILLNSWTMINLPPNVTLFLLKCEKR